MRPPFFQICGMFLCLTDKKVRRDYSSQPRGREGTSLLSVAGLPSAAAVLTVCCVPAIEKRGEKMVPAAAATPSTRALVTTHTKIQQHAPKNNTGMRPFLPPTDKRFMQSVSSRTRTVRSGCSHLNNRMLPLDPIEEDAHRTRRSTSETNFRFEFTLLLHQPQREGQVKRAIKSADLQEEMKCPYIPFSNPSYK